MQASVEEESVTQAGPNSSEQVFSATTSNIQVNSNTFTNSRVQGSDNVNKFKGFPIHNGTIYTFIWATSVELC